MKKIVLTLTLAAVMAGALAGTASAAQVCNHHRTGSTYAEVTVWGTPSSQMGRAPVAQAATFVARSGSAPYSMLARSPVTHRRYRMTRRSYDNNGDYFSAVYSGRGAN